jgi:hypothetical protein
MSASKSRLDRVDLSDVTRSFGRDVLMGLAAGVSSALDVPEVDFAAIDDLIQRLETFAQSLELRPFLLWEVRIASLELALAMGSPKTIDKACTELTPLAEKHEDIEERFLAQLRIVQAHRTRGRLAPTEAAALSASRLDKRLNRTTYAEQLARELAEGPLFPLKDAARLPTFL